MSDIDQRTLTDQRLETLGAREAAAVLGVKLPTLYAYVSRGLLRSAAADSGRARRYFRSEIDTLRARRDRRPGYGPVAARALRWGEPVLDSSITSLDERGPSYRGRLAVELAEEGVPFEAVAELLWTGTLPERPPRWEIADLGLRRRHFAALVPSGAPLLARLAVLVPALAARDPGRFDRRPEVVLPRARRLLSRLATALAFGGDFRRAGDALHAGRVARVIALAAGSGSNQRATRAIDEALVLIADHELNVSAFAARVAASAGADVYACISAAVAALSGPRHGGSIERIEAVVAEIGEPARAREVVHERFRRGERVPGFGHPLYPAGDPRARLLLAAADRLAPRSLRLRSVFALIEAMRDAGRGEPTVDLGLVALSAALGLPRGSAVGLFAVGRTAGWVAHVLEQYAAGFLIRPRARYRGVTS